MQMQRGSSLQPPLVSAVGSRVEDRTSTDSAPLFSCSTPLSPPPLVSAFSRLHPSSGPPPHPTYSASQLHPSFFLAAAG
ncbi:unnamed protein product [Staurois parvus]|uniref:Uncharacterized protein n=1 Tax=Staurois parvus TaxID=386267 RepID=A0ABN9GK93_9NEOB|nr:unnamed protein product [Staurois parvus]